MNHCTTVFFTYAFLISFLNTTATIGSYNGMYLRVSKPKSVGSQWRAFFLENWHRVYFSVVLTWITTLIAFSGFSEILEVTGTLVWCSILRFFRSLSSSLTALVFSPRRLCIHTWGLSWDHQASPIYQTDRTHWCILLNPMCCPQAF